MTKDTETKVKPKFCTANLHWIDAGAERCACALLTASVPPQKAMPQSGDAQAHSDDGGDPTFDGWVPKFTALIVRNGDSLPMVVDAVFDNEADAKARASVHDGGNWWAMKYSHLQPPANGSAR